MPKLSVYFKPETNIREVDQKQLGQDLGCYFSGGGFLSDSRQVYWFAYPTGEDINRGALSKYPMIERIESS